MRRISTQEEINAIKRNLQEYPIIRHVFSANLLNNLLDENRDVRKQHGLFHVLKAEDSNRRLFLNTFSRDLSLTRSCDGFDKLKVDLENPTGFFAHNLELRVAATFVNNKDAKVEFNPDLGPDYDVDVQILLNDTTMNIQCKRIIPAKIKKESEIIQDLSILEESTPTPFGYMLYGIRYINRSQVYALYKQIQGLASNPSLFPNQVYDLRLDDGTQYQVEIYSLDHVGLIGSSDILKDSLLSKVDWISNIQSSLKKAASQLPDRSDKTRNLVFIESDFAISEFEEKSAWLGELTVQINRRTKERRIYYDVSKGFASQTGRIDGVVYTQSTAPELNYYIIPHPKFYECKRIYGTKDLLRDLAKFISRGGR